MRSEGKTYVQCQRCGEVTTINGDHDLIEEMYVDNWKCPCCEHTVGLNLGSNKDDIYELYNVNYDSRYYNY